MELKSQVITRILLAHILFSFVSLDALQAEEFHVTTAAEFQNALTKARGNGEADNIWLDAGTYKTIDNQSRFMYEAKEGEDYALTIKGETGTSVDDVILDGEEPTFAFYLLDIEQENAPLTIQGISTKNGFIEISSSGDVSLTKNKFSHNKLYHPVYVNTSSGSITVSGNIFEGCGIYANTSSGNIHVTNNAISGGSIEESGGGIYASTSSGNINLTSNTISKNKATDYNYAYGGGVYLSASGNITLNNNTIIENEVSHDSGFSRGGGVYIHSLGIVTINKNTIRKNITSSHGGGLHIDSTDDIILVNNIIAGNTAGKNAGGIYAHSTLGRIILTNNTITDNKTPPKDDFYTPKGGGLYLNCQEEDASAYIYNNIIWGNESDLGEDVYIDAHIFSSIYVHNNNYHDVESRPFTEDVDNIDDDSLFANSEQGDYHLQSNSPCIDKGTADAPELPSTDYENDLRIIGSSPDMGADEYYDPSIYSTTTTTTISPQPCTTEQIYGEHSEQAGLLRYFRNNVLNQTLKGQEIIRLYYQWSPVIVKAMEADEKFKQEVKEMIDGVLGLISEEVE